MIFEKNEVNTGRQFEFDVAKTFAVLFMIVVHVFDHMVNPGSGILLCVVEFFGCPPAAGVFMFSMGLGMVFTRHDEPREFAARGIKLLIMGYVLNFFRETILILLGNILGVENSYEGVSLFSSFMVVDILQFAGIAFLLVALFKKMKMKPWVILAVSLLLNALGGLRTGLFDNASEYIQYPLGLFIYTNSQTGFPAFQWMVYPALGICFGHLLRHVADKEVFYRRMLVLSVASVALITLGFYAYDINVRSFFLTEDYYMQIFPTLIWCLCIVDFPGQYMIITRLYYQNIISQMRLIYGNY